MFRQQFNPGRAVGLNDVFDVSVHPELQLTSIHGSVYDRWGNLVYESTNPQFSWDGNFKTKPMMQGVYVVKLEIVYLLNGVEYKEVKTVDVSLVR